MRENMLTLSYCMTSHSFNLFHIKSRTNLLGSDKSYQAMVTLISIICQDLDTAQSNEK